MLRAIGMDTHRTFGKVVIWEEGKLRHAGRVDITRTGLEEFGKSLMVTDDAVIEATGNCMAVSRVLSPFVARVVITNRLQMKAIAHAHVKTDNVHNHFSLERHFADQQTYGERRSAALAEWQVLASKVATFKGPGASCGERFALD